jgi:hypothetical protein
MSTTVIAINPRSRADLNFIHPLFPLPTGSAIVLEMNFTSSSPGVKRFVARFTRADPYEAGERLSFTFTAGRRGCRQQAGQHRSSVRTEERPAQFLAQLAEEFEFAGVDPPALRRSGGAAFESAAEPEVHARRSLSRQGKHAGLEEEAPYPQL